MEFEIEGRKFSCRINEEGRIVIAVKCRICDGSGVERWDDARGTPCIVRDCKEGRLELEVDPFYERIIRKDIRTVHSRSWVAPKRNPRLVDEGVPYETWKPGDTLPDDIPERFKGPR